MHVLIYFVTLMQLTSSVMVGNTIVQKFQGHASIQN